MGCAWNDWSCCSGFRKIDGLRSLREKSFGLQLRKRLLQWKGNCILFRIIILCCKVLNFEDVSSLISEAAGVYIPWRVFDDCIASAKWFQI